MTKWKASVFAVALMAAVATPGQVRAQPTEAKLGSAGSNLCLQPVGGGAWNGNKVQQVTCLPNDDTQLWTFQDGTNPGDGNYYRIKNKGTKLCLDNTDGSSTDRTVMQVWECNSSTTMWWKIGDHLVTDTSGAVPLINLRTHKCLDATTSHPLSGAYATIYHCAYILAGTKKTPNLAQYWKSF